MAVNFSQTHPVEGMCIVHVCIRNILTSAELFFELTKPVSHSSGHSTCSPYGSQTHPCEWLPHLLIINRTQGYIHNCTISTRKVSMKYNLPWSSHWRAWIHQCPVSYRQWPSVQPEGNAWGPSGLQDSATGLYQIVNFEYPYPHSFHTYLSSVTSLLFVSWPDMS